MGTCRNPTENAKLPIIMEIMQKINREIGNYRYGNPRLRQGTPGREATRAESAEQYRLLYKTGVARRKEATSLGTINMSDVREKQPVPGTSTGGGGEPAKKANNKRGRESDGTTPTGKKNNNKKAGGWQKVQSKKDKKAAKKKLKNNQRKLRRKKEGKMFPYKLVIGTPEGGKINLTSWRSLNITIRTKAWGLYSEWLGAGKEIPNTWALESSAFIEDTTKLKAGEKSSDKKPEERWGYGGYFFSCEHALKFWDIAVDRAQVRNEAGEWVKATATPGAMDLRAVYTVEMESAAYLALIDKRGSPGIRQGFCAMMLNAAANMKTIPTMEGLEVAKVYPLASDYAKIIILKVLCDERWARVVESYPQVDGKYQVKTILFGLKFKKKRGVIKAPAGAEKAKEDLEKMDDSNSEYVDAEQSK